MPCRHLGLAGRRKHGCGRRPVRAPERFSRLLAAMRQKNPRDWRTCLMPRLRRESIEKLTAIRVWSVAIVHISWRANPASSAGKFLSRNQTSTIYSIANVMSHSRRRKENGQKREYLPITSPHFPTKTRPSGRTALHGLWRRGTAVGPIVGNEPPRPAFGQPRPGRGVLPGGHRSATVGAKVRPRPGKGVSPDGGEGVSVCVAVRVEAWAVKVSSQRVSAQKKGSMCGLYGKKPYLCATLVTQ